MFFVAGLILSFLFGVTAVLNWFAGQEVSLLHWIVGLPGLITIVVALPFALMSDR